MSIQKEIKSRVYLTYVLMCLFALAIVGRIAHIQIVEGDKWRAKAESQTTIFRTVEAARGNIFTADGSLLATSEPIYEVRWDANVSSLTDDYFKENIGQLSKQLAGLFEGKSAAIYRRELTQARNDTSRFYLIKRNVDHKALKQLRQFAIFNQGQHQGGFIYLQGNERVKPFGELASRTIGYDLKGYSVGLEGAYSTDLAGVGGKRLMQKIAGGHWKPLNDENEIEPENGSDLITTIDINIQDVAEQALLTQLEKHGAHHGCAVLMEVETGNVKAIANLTLQKSGAYAETYNYAVGASTEPGSTFKLASMICLLEDGFVTLEDTVDVEGGIKKYYTETMEDSKIGVYDKITVAKAFEISSNVGVSKLVTQYYSAKPEKLVERLKAMHLNEPLGLEIKGEGEPSIPSPNDKSWSGISLPWMSIGYGVLQTPMQILALYNAIANNGKLVRPKMVSTIKKRGEIEKEFPPVVLDERICSQKTIDQVKILLEGVVDNGTARNLKHANYKIAGKTGTTQIAKSGSYHKEKRYQASFVGYFPADKPRYTCIVVVDSPSKGTFYGSQVAGPVFKEISDKVYSTQIKMQEEVVTDPLLADRLIPISKVSDKNDLTRAFSELGIQTDIKDPSAQWVVAKATSGAVVLAERQVLMDLVPSVVGMGAMDALFLLENMGLDVKIIGSGAVILQSIIPGTEAAKGREIVIQLS